MKTLALALGISAAALFSGPSLAAPFTCPTPSLVGVSQPADIASLLPSGDALDDVVKLNAGVAALRARGVQAAVIVDRLIGNYCTAQLANASLTDAQRTARVRGFAARIVRIVYALDSADAIILDVAFPPDMVNAINAKAKAAGVSPEDWVVDAVISVLQAKP